MLLRPLHGERASIGEHYNDRLTYRSHRLEKILFRRGQIEAGAVATVEARLGHHHLFTFKLAGNAHDRDHYIGIFRRGFGCRIDVAVDPAPHQTHMRRPAAGAAKLQLQMVRLAGFKVHAPGQRFKSMRIIRFGHAFAIEPQANESIGFNAKIVVACLLRRECRVPAHRERLHSRNLRRHGLRFNIHRRFRARGQFGSGRLVLHCDFGRHHVLLQISDFRAQLAVCGEQLGRYGPGFLAEEPGAGNVVDRCVRKLLLQPFQDGNGVRRNSVVVAQQNAGLIGQRANDSNLDAL